MISKFSDNIWLVEYYKKKKKRKASVSLENFNVEDSYAILSTRRGRTHSQNIKYHPIEVVGKWG